MRNRMNVREAGGTAAKHPTQRRRCCHVIRWRPNRAEPREPHGNSFPDSVSPVFDLPKYGILSENSLTGCFLLGYQIRACRAWKGVLPGGVIQGCNSKPSGE